MTFAVLKAFDYKQRGYRAGDLVEMEPLDAAIHARKGHISLAKLRKPSTQTADLEPDAPPKRRRYRRRDMEPER